MNRHSGLMGSAPAGEPGTIEAPESTSEQLEQLLQGAARVQAARSELEALEAVAHVVQRAGWSSVSAHSFRDWTKVAAAYAGMTSEEIAFFEERPITREQRAAQYSEARAPYRISRSYFVPEEAEPEVTSGYPVMASMEINADDPGVWRPRDLAYVPMHAHDETIIGAIALDNPTNGKRPDEETFRRLEFFADLAGQVIERLRIDDAHDRVQAEMREREGLLRTLLSSMPDLVCFKDGDGRWLEINDYGEQMFQLEEIEWRGLTDLELADLSFFHRAAFLACVESDRATWEAGVAHRGDEAIPQPDGSVTVLDVIKCPTFHEDGRRKSLIVVGRDVTEQRRAERQLRESERQLRLLTDHTDDVVSLNSIDGERIYISPSLRRITGWTEDVLRADDWRERVHPEDLPAIEAAHQANRGGERTSVEFRFRCNDGSTIWLETQATPVRGQDGEVEHIVCTSRNITARKHTEEALRFARADWQRSFDAIDDFVCTLDTSGSIVRANRAMREQFEPVHGDLTGMSYLEVYCGTPNPDPTPPCAGVLCGKPAVSVETEIPVLPGYYRVSSYPLTSGSGELLGAVSVVRDITQRRESEDALRMVAESRRLLLSELEHRVRNNLGSLLMIIDLSCGRARSGEELASALRSRVLAIASVHETLSGNNWHGGDLESMVRLLIRPSRSDQLQLAGPPALIPLNQAQAFGLVINELATNSSKYGALGSSHGKVRLTWTTQVAANDQTALTISWKEMGGPPLETAPEPGAGLRLIEGLCQWELRGTVTFSFPKSGAYHELTMMLGPDATAQFTRVEG